ncbi:alanine racemase [Wenzhouxiangella sp. AB-CW3]|uniref:alanine racemase n=1 Tax=Wenzhouxiangella sp. AB-CW3 TaxID=2771012 RepID=UPI00168A4935|nr:alanine racemase [Wenzhouxiangella sp. AB-CW3]QOC23871.1 alanine racemase [Wenzhouxiangella sp. AB-CW3]
MARNTLARISTDAIAANLARVRACAPDSRVMAVVKADAYGHRIDLCLSALRNADMLAVATIEEARAIRRLGNGLPVLLLEGVNDPGDLAIAAELGLELTVHHPRQVQALERFGRAISRRLWLKIDSGMHRLGVDGGQAAVLHQRMLDLPGVEQVNLMTHLACAEESDHPLNSRQLERFDRTVAGLEGEHCLANSAAIFNWPAVHRDWVRAGIVLYGISPMSEGSGADLGLAPAMTLSSELLAVNHVAAGESIGYGGRYVASRDMRVGVAAIGYGDGYPRSIRDGAHVLVNGRRCRLAGRVSMDMITIDLANCPEAGIGDPVLLWGEGLPVEEVARAADTIPYELVCRITRRVRYLAAPRPVRAVK